MSDHSSDCAVHNAPAYPPGQCDCNASPSQRQIEEAIAAEREACAKVAEAVTTYDPENWCAETSKTIAAAIRARRSRSK